MDGFINLLKPPGITSHDAVNYMRKLFPKIKIGHGGTLDPGAAGVLPLLLGKATKFSSYLINLSKIYRVELFLGVTTDTEDSSGKIIAKSEPPPLSIKDFQLVLSSFQGEIEQVPPMYAAIKQKGKKLYEYARQGITVERPARKVRIYSIKIFDYFPPKRALLEVKCSKGTYMRTLCAQIGAALGCGGHMSFLLRKAVGGFLLSQTCVLDGLNLTVDAHRAQQALLPLDFPFRSGNHIVLKIIEINRLSQGQFLSWPELQDKAVDVSGEPVDEKVLPIYTTKREFVGLGKWEFDKTAGFHLRSVKILRF